jgi:hypothetical protein
MARFRDAVSNPVGVSDACDRQGGDPQRKRKPPLSMREGRRKEEAGAECKSSAGPYRSTVLHLLRAVRARGGFRACGASAAASSAFACAFA